MKKKTKNKPPIVEIIWEDHWSQAGWHYGEDGHTPLVPSMHSNIGYLVKKDKKGITLAGTWANDAKDGAQFGNISYRLVSCVTKMRYIK